MKKIFKTSMCIMLVISMLAFPEEKLQAKTYTGVIEDKFKYTFDTENLVVTFEGEGSFDGNYDTDTNDVLWRYGSSHMRWVLGEGITQIESLKKENYVISIQLPQSLRIIDNYAFNKCRGLRRITIPAGVEFIGKEAFANSGTLRQITNYSNQTVYLPSYFSSRCKYPLPFDYYVNGELAVTVPPGKTAVGVGKAYRVHLECNGGKLGSRKLKVGVPMQRKNGPSEVEIQYSTNKSFKKHQSVVVSHDQVMRTGTWEFTKKNKKKHYKLAHNRKKEMLTITLSKLKTKKTYYFRFRYSGGLAKPDGSELSWYNTGDWFKKSVKM